MWLGVTLHGFFRPPPRQQPCRCMLELRARMSYCEAVLADEMPALLAVIDDSPTRWFTKLLAAEDEQSNCRVAAKKK